MPGVPFFSIGSGELADLPEIPDEVTCKCGARCRVKFSEGKAVKLGFIDCKSCGATYLVSINGKDLTRYYRDTGRW